jgi:two-component system phosphate regulon sensor histidine kinase PhoR
MKMKRRIYFSFLLLALVSMLLTACACAFVSFDAEGSRLPAQARRQLQSLAAGLNRAEDPIALLRALPRAPEGERLTLIAPDGTARFDSLTGAPAADSYADRPEFQAALAQGFGENSRLSATLDETTFCAAQRLDSGDVLRLAETTRSPLGTLWRALPLLLQTVFALWILSFFAARYLTRRVVAPISRMQIEGDAEQAYEEAYDELAPLVRTIARQRAKIAEQARALDTREHTTLDIVQGMREGLLLLDSQATVLIANRGALDFFALPEGDYVGKNLLELTRDLGIVGAARAALAGERGERTLRTGARTVRIFFNPVLAQDRVQGRLALMLDVTAHTDAERVRREFSANVSHELRTPLTTILGYAQMIAGGIAKPEDVQGFAQKIQGEVERLVALIQDIIRLSELDERAELAGPLQPVERFDLREAIDAACARLKPAAEAKRVALECQGEPLPILANRRMVDMLLSNLIDNAIRYNLPEGRVRVACSVQDDQARIDVSDTGIGIPPEHLERVFERFYRVDASRSKKTGGTGLGLSIVKHIAQVHGGRAVASSAEGQGATVTVWLGLENG